MKTSKELKEVRASKLQAQQDLVTAAKVASRDLQDDEASSFDALTAEIRELNAQIIRAEEIEKLELEAASKEGVVIDEPQKMEETRFSIVRALNALVNNKGLSGAEQRAHELAVAELRIAGVQMPENAGFSIPSAAMRAQTVGDDSGAKGGKLVASDPQLVMPLQPKLAIADLGVNVMTGLVGDVPLNTSTTFSFNFVGETADVTGTDVNFAGPTLKPKRVAGVVELSRKLLLQSSVDVEKYIIDQINIAIGQAVVKAAINGGGGDAPTGLYSLITSNISAAAGAPTWDSVVELESFIEKADATDNALAYVCDPALKGKLKTTKKDAGSGLFLSEGNELNGQKLIATSLMPTLDAGASHPLIYGDWSQLTVGYWGGMSFIVDPYTKASSGKIRLIIELYADVAVANEKAFAINKALTV